MKAGSHRDSPPPRCRTGRSRLADHVRAGAHRGDGRRMGDRLPVHRDQSPDAPLGVDANDDQPDNKGQPNTWVVRLTDDALFNCPITLVSDAGTVGFTPEEGERLREYLLKGGFLWADNFWAPLGPLGGANRPGAPAQRFPHRRRPGERSDLPEQRRCWRMHDHQHPLLAQRRRRRNRVGAWDRQRRDALPSHSRPAQRDHGGDNTHNTDIADSSRRGGRCRLLPSVLAPTVRVRHQRDPARHDPLNGSTGFAGFHRVPRGSVQPGSTGLWVRAAAGFENGT